MYSAPDKLPRRFSIIQNVCDFTRLSLEASNALSISGQCVEESRCFAVICIELRECATHLVIKKGVYVVQGGLNSEPRVDTGTS